MAPEIQFFLGGIIFASGLSYAWWVWFRVWMLRQDLFAIRDELWRSMKDLNELDDPAHRELREGINAFIRIAPWLSIFTILRILAEGAHSQFFGIGEVIPKEVELAKKKVVLRVARYLFLETLLGLGMVTALLIGCLLILMPFAFAKSLLSRKVETVLDSAELRAIGRLVATPGSRAFTHA